MDVARRQMRLSTSRKRLPQNVESSANNPALFLDTQPLESIDEDNSMSISKGTILPHERRFTLSPINCNVIKRRSKGLSMPLAVGVQQSEMGMPTLVPKAPSTQKTSLCKDIGRTDLGSLTVTKANFINSIKENVEFQNVTECLATAISSCAYDNSIDFVDLSPEAMSMYSRSKTPIELSVPRSKDPVYNKRLFLDASPIAIASRCEASDVKTNNSSGCKVAPGVSSNALGQASPNKSIRDSFMNIIPLSRPRSPKTDDEDDDLLPTQPILGSLLKSVVAYVEVRTGDDNRSWGVKDHLRRMGATIADRFTKNVTHVVFKEGSMATYKKALRLKVFLVSVLWIEECKIARTIVSENLYPPYDMERYESPHLYPKLKRVKSMQPDFENKREAEYFKRKRKKRMPEHNLEQENKILDLLYPIKPRIADDSPSMLRALKCAAAYEPDYEDYVNRATSPNPSEEDVPPPLAIRLLREYMQSPQRAKPNTNAELQPQQTHLMPKQVDGDVAMQVTPPSSVQTQHINDNNPIPATNEQTCINPSQATMRLDSPVKIPSGINSQLKSPTVSQNVPARRKSLRQEILTAKTKATTLADEKTDSFTIAKRSRVRKFDQNSSHSQQKITSFSQRRKLMNITQPDDSPVLITPLIDDDIPIRPTYPYTPPKSRRKACKGRHIPVDMDLTDVVPASNIILVNTAAKNTAPKNTAAKNTAAKNTSAKNTSCKSKANSQSQKEGNKENCSVTKYMSRRSSVLFKENKFQEDVSIIKTRQIPSIVFTSLHKVDSESASAAVEALKGFEVEEKVSNRTTHVVTSLPLRRTLNLLRGIVRGCWIVKKEWVFKSQQAGKWVDEEKYELTEFSPTVQQYRLEKLAFGPVYKPDLFSACGPIFVCRTTNPPSRDLSELITLCGGRVTPNPRQASVVVGKATRSLEATSLKESWVLDSITDGSPKRVQDYAIQTPPSPVHT